MAASEAEIRQILADLAVIKSLGEATKAQIERFDARITALEVRMTDLERRVSVEETRNLDIQNDVKGLNSTATWITRAAIGLLIAAIFNVVLKAGGGIGP